ncbi:hypothetical protein OsI_31822 [Oryza sativa Indica Group]|uniref:JmjC domain-containing protein n=1 Tax=Oryza sativa subsp. indica TaxID=39946 RepID=B8BCU9_ORYSI|nr:hypothetical protein OsI_31822 [Oryza sativa Indica Group]
MERAVRELWAESRDLLGLHSPDDAAAADAAMPRAEMPPTPLAFLRDHVSPGRPLLVSSAATSHWPAASLWPTDSYLTDALRSTAVSLHLTPDGRADALAPHPRPSHPGAKCFASAHVRQVDFPTAVRLIRSSDPASGLVAYAQQQDDCLRGEYAAVAGDVDAHVPWASRRARLPPRGHEAELRLKLELEEPERIVPWSSVDPYPPSPEEAAAQASSFPLYFEGPRPIRCTVRAGEMLYLPSMWFHHVSQSPGPNGLTIAVNYWYDMQFDIKYAYFNFLRSLEIDGSSPKKTDALEDDLEETND